MVRWAKMGDVRYGPHWALNGCVDALVAAGKYHEALALPEDYVVRGSRDTASELLVQINLAEAEYNLGLWDDAWDRLRDLDPLTAAFPIARAGLAQQRAWIAAHTGKPDEALHWWRRADLDDLPRNYHAEHFFTGAVACLGVARHDGARRCALAGAAAAMRPSSKRNALFIRARVAAAINECSRAESLCQEAAAFPYRAQGGDGLLLWGDLLTRLERPAEAQEAYALAVARDRQSVSARLAAERLRELAGRNRRVSSDTAGR